MCVRLRRSLVSLVASRPMCMSLARKIESLISCRVKISLLAVFFLSLYRIYLWTVVVIVVYSDSVGSGH